ncbi:MAG: xylulokinase [bacterium]
MDALLGLDVGTSATKAVLFDDAGQQLATAQHRYPLQTPHPGWVEQDPEQVWQALVGAVRDVLQQVEHQPIRVRALAPATQSGSLILANGDGLPLYPMVTWLDTRAEEVVQQWQADGLEEMIWRRSGWHLNPGFPLPVLAWFRQQRPELLAAAERAMGLNDFILHRLCGSFVTDRSSASEMLLLDWQRAAWSETLCDLAGVSPQMLPAIRPSGVAVGRLSPAASAATGLPRETMVISGAHDQCCAAAAMGVTEPGQLLLAAGTAWVLTGVAARAAMDDVPPQMDLSFHAIPRRWTISQLLGGFGAVLAWWLRETGPTVENAEEQQQLFAQLEAGLVDTAPGSRDLLFVPPGAGAQLPQRVRSGGFLGLRLDHRRADMARAVLEGIACEVRWALDSARQKGLPVDLLLMNGGATHSPAWAQIIADLGGVPLTLAPAAQWPARGAALLAGRGIGLWSESDMPPGWAPSTRIPSRPDNHAAYEATFSRYRAGVRRLLAAAPE